MLSNIDNTQINKLLDRLNDDELRRLIKYNVDKSSTLAFYCEKNNLKLTVEESIIIDPGTSPTIVCNKKLITDLKPTSLEISGISSELVGVEFGTMTLRLENDDIIEITNALYAPSSKCNLLAIDVFKEHGYEVAYTLNGVCMLRDAFLNATPIGTQVENKLYFYDQMILIDEKFTTVQAFPAQDISGFYAQASPYSSVVKFITNEDFDSTSEKISSNIKRESNPF
ncbi:hypothetical protein Kpol_1075p6 [Vanderwaltozyma polyspora DSM 70294]|uniref:Retrovirus-related Pol polyprotein from transposon TNT 1-94-like beta-barrel domain-containing protein n=1 Tax=Vanderwaltozyma polyspora (strain ATCC 22028 / DSM 70294 / BCRC 21397 / CBS 2163 / NBRC 10782 / NRRL Y-8283 / UCD 57-17) TaxID=436907 RepID=A7TSN4_VANPO|nr:uncharacterized protein Kpol_1075p6 [Vanderwaltozyma polyspora DSM 70294]EDO14728.1 hypothetical protein Kpol_1075p6 [Vanderwaltozyma polyspora DSM 70294]